MVKEILNGNINECIMCRIVKKLTESIYLVSVCVCVFECVSVCLSMIMHECALYTEKMFHNRIGMSVCVCASVLVSQFAHISPCNW